ICAVLSGARSFRAIAQWVKTLSEEQRVALGFKQGRTATETAFRRFLNAVNGERLSAVLGAWFERHVAPADLRVLAGDGKTLRGSATVTAKDASPARLLSLTRGHWAIENRSHFVRDVSFGEDACRIQRGHGPHAFAALRNAAIGIARLAGA